LSTDLCAAGIFAPAEGNSLPLQSGEITTRLPEIPAFTGAELRPRESADRAGLSAWSRSGAKRAFDLACVLSSLPVLIPLLLLVALAVWMMSGRPVLFLQKRVGRHGRRFTILKFRTLENVSPASPAGQRFTPLGRFLRRWKLDELPQLVNVLIGDMSLVGPRPKMREYQLGVPVCRPGITGAATIAFACEEELLERVAKLRSGSTYRAVVMPAKLRLDAHYMAQATFASDVKLILDSILRRWDQATLQSAIAPVASAADSAHANRCAHPGRRITRMHGPSLPKFAGSVEAEAAVPF
jgi:lipopolysaccharide/colanic/teichoic acid biosynthesis glycosyltransferase